MDSNTVVGCGTLSRKICRVIIQSVFCLLLLSGCTSSSTVAAPEKSDEAMIVKLPEAKIKGNISLEETLYKRRSVRDFTSEPLSLEAVSQLLWAAQGITSDWGGRTAPSAGGLYPLEIYLVAGNVSQLAPGIYKYIPQSHELRKVKEGDVRKQLAGAALGQSCVQDGAINIVIAAVYARVTPRYSERALRYVHMEAGHAAQNVYLQANALNLGTVAVGAFIDAEVKKTIAMPENEAPLYLLPVGHPQN